MSVEDVKAQLRTVIDQELHGADLTIRQAHAIGSRIITGLMQLRTDMEAMQTALGGDNAAAMEGIRGQTDEHDRLSKVASNELSEARDNVDRIVQGSGNELTSEALTRISYASTQAHQAHNATFSADVRMAEVRGHLASAINLLDKTVLNVISGQEHLAGEGGALQSILVAEDNLETYIAQR